MRGHCVITSRLRVGGFFENVTKRDGGGWVGWAERDVTLKLKINFQICTYLNWKNAMRNSYNLVANVGYKCIIYIL